MTDGADRKEGFRTRVVRVIRDRLGLHEHLALPIANEVVDALQEEFGGRHVYIDTKSPSRDDQVRAAFNGRNQAEVMEQFEISRATFYRIIGKPLK